MHNGTQARIGGLQEIINDLPKIARRFGGGMIQLAVNFRQTLPVIPRITHADDINVFYKLSYFWQRVALQNDPSADDYYCLISIPPNVCQITSSKKELMGEVFRNIGRNSLNHDWLSDCAILFANIIEVDQLNFILQNQIAASLHMFKSVDGITNDNKAIINPIKILNSTAPPNDLQPDN